MSSQADQGLMAFNEGKYDKAIELYSKALESSKSPLWLIQRSTAYQRTKQYELALADAEAALLVANDRGRREQIASAQFRRAITLYKMERFGDARMALNWSREGNDKEKGLTNWMSMISQGYDACPEDDVRRKIVIEKFPGNVSSSQQKRAKKASESTVNAVAPAVQAPKLGRGASTPLEKIRHEWYQSTNQVTISIMARDIPKDLAKVEFQDSELKVAFPVGASETYDFSICPLFSSIAPSDSKYIVTPTKLEITLGKSSAIKWPSLKGDASSTVAKPILPTSSNFEKPPAYPTSSKTGPKNWDAMKSFELTDNSGKTEKIEVKDDDYDEEGDELNGFFKKLYKDADPDTRRAMLKSYQESDGTSLSTNWADVGSKSFKPEDEKKENGK